MRIAILGTGGVGGYFGGRLASAGTDVTFIARGAHLAALKSQGLRIESPDGNLHLPSVKATSDPASIGPVDLVFFTVKLYDTESAVKTLPPLIGAGTLVVPFQNGVDSVQVLTEAVGAEHVAGGTTYVAAAIAEPGLIRHTAMGRLIFGPVSGPPPSALQELRDACAHAHVDASLSERIMVDIWAKFVRLTVLSGMTAVARAPIGTVRQDPVLRDMMEAGLRESVAVAQAMHVPLPTSLAGEAMAAMMSLTPEMKSSMLVDLEYGRRLELPWLSGAVVRIGEETGVPTPTHRLIVALLKPHVNGTPAA